MEESGGKWRIERFFKPIVIFLGGFLSHQTFKPSNLKTFKPSNPKPHIPTIPHTYTIKPLYCQIKAY